VTALPNVNLKLLQAFLLVSEHGSFRVAADLSFRSSSAMSAQIRQLEEQLGVPLFHRTTRNVKLTNEGKQLVECAKRALMEVDSGLRKIQEAADIRRGRVSLSCSPTIAATRLARVLAAFESEHPGIEVYVRELNSEPLFESVRSLSVDLGIGPIIDTPEFEFEPLLDDSMYALMPKRMLGTVRASSETITFGALTKFPLLVLSHATQLRAAIEAAMKERNRTLATRYEFTQAQTLITMASAGLGVAILPRIALPQTIDANMAALRITSPALKRRIGLITARGRSLSPASQRLAELLKQLLPEPEEIPAIARDSKPPRRTVRRQSRKTS
jgi:DNA-binding transcriptional LysR family regulator